MTKTIKPDSAQANVTVDRRGFMGLAAAAGAAAAFTNLSDVSIAAAKQATGSASPKAFVYSEIQVSVPFAEAKWQNHNPLLRKQPGLLNKTWLSGVGTNSLGGFYEFNSKENALEYANVFLPGEAKKIGAAQTSIVFDAAVVEEASRDINSPHFGGELDKAPGAFVYTEVQVSVPFEKAPWRKRNPIIKQQPGLLCKTWLAGHNTRTLGGFEVFDTLENAKAYALEAFPKVAKRINAAYVTKIFDANVVIEASRQMKSPYFT